MSLSIKGDTIRDMSDGGKTVESGTKTHREAVRAAREHGTKAGRGAKSFGFPDTPEVDRAFQSLRKRKKGRTADEGADETQETQAADEGAETKE